jgi:Co/Zn/Cd efflux system component
MSSGHRNASTRSLRTSAGYRHDANRALVLSALGLTLTGGIELAIALISGSVGLLSDAIHNLAARCVRATGRGRGRGRLRVR